MVGNRIVRDEAGEGVISAAIAVLALNREKGDPGRLISEEARAIRHEVQRVAVATMERRAEQV